MIATPGFLRVRLMAALFAGVGLGAGTSADAQTAPVIGSPNTVTADALVPRPSTTPCTVTLFSGQTFADFNSKTFQFTPPTNCPGPWQKVVLAADYSVTAGRQFDRTAEIWIGGVNVYFGTTPEPQATVARSWHVERDLTDYSALFATAQGGRADLGNLVNSTYTGVISGTATISFYPLAPTVFDHPPRPDVVLPLSGGPTGGTADLKSSTDQLAVTFSTLPTNIERAFLDVYAQSQASDEFWYTCVPNDVASALQSCPGTGFREVEVSVDGQPAGVAPVYPWIYTGGIDPYVWRPVPGVQTLAFTPYRVDLTPFAGALDDGKAHTLALSVFNTQDHFSTAAVLLLYLDHGATTVTGGVTSNTLAAAPSPKVTENSTTNGGEADSSVGITSSRQFTIAGTVNTSHGPVTTQLQQDIEFSNQQQFKISSTLYTQDIVQTTTVDSTTSVSANGYTSIVHEQRSYPLTLDINIVVAADGSQTQATTVDQEFQQGIDFGYQGFTARHAALDDHVVNADTLAFDASGNFTGHSGQSATQTYAYGDPFGACYSRQITASAGTLATVTDGQNCPQSTNALSWFDAFYNAASSVAGATVQILP